jgi:hypothetical protein
MVPQTLQKIANNGLATQRIDNKCKQGQWQSFLRFSYPDHLGEIYLHVDEDSVLGSDGQVLVVSFGELKVISTLRDSTDTFVEKFFQWGTRLKNIIPCLTGIYIFPPRIVLGYDMKNKFPPINVSSIIVPPSVKWANFITHVRNKEILVRFLLQQLILQTSADHNHCSIMKVE